VASTAPQCGAERFTLRCEASLRLAFATFWSARFAKASGNVKVFVIRSLYTVLLAAGLIVTAPAYAIRAAKRGTGLALSERLGSVPETAAALRERRPVWVHAVSVGEVTAAAPLLRAIKSRYPGLSLLVTTVTATGRQTVTERVPQADATAYFPLDMPWAVNRALEAVRPGLFLSVETELWPNFLFALAERGVPAFLVNARLTDRSARRYGWARRVFAPALAGLMGVAAQTASDARRLASIGVDPNRIMITGSLKFDQGADETHAAIRRADLGLASGERLWVAGSTHPGEESQLLDAYRRVRAREPHLVLLLAPRHLDRLDKVEALVRDAGCESIRRSAIAAGRGRTSANPPVILLDTLGELASVYTEAEVAFVGGTLAPVGGHNLLEPAARGKPVLFGPHTHKCEEIAHALREAGGGVRVESAAALAEHVQQLLADETLRARMGQCGLDMVARNRGAVDRTVSLLDPWLSELGARP
jgi:3-deoxy-D-manno-octulosonic-acid transferase